MALPAKHRSAGVPARTPSDRATPPADVTVHYIETFARLTPGDLRPSRGPRRHRWVFAISVVAGVAVATAVVVDRLRPGSESGPAPARVSVPPPVPSARIARRPPTPPPVALPEVIPDTPARVPAPTDVPPRAAARPSPGRPAATAAPTSGGPDQRPAAPAAPADAPGRPAAAPPSAAAPTPRAEVKGPTPAPEPARVAVRAGPAPSTPRPAPGVGEAEVRRLLDRYAAAWGSGNVAALRSVGQITTDGQAEAMERYFGSVRDLAVEVSVLGIDTRDGRTTVRFTRRDRFRDPAGREVTKQSPPIVKELERTPSGLRFRPPSG